MARNIKQVLLCFFLCISIFLSFIYVADTAAAGDNQLVSTEQQEESLQAESVLMPSLFSLRPISHTKTREGQVRNILYFFFTILFKIVLIPNLILAVIGSSLRCIAPLQQRILTFIQDKDGKKRPLAYLN